MNPFLFLLFLLPWPWVFLNKSKPLIFAENWIRRWQLIPQRQLTSANWHRILASRWESEMTLYCEKQGEQYPIKMELSDAQRKSIVELLLDSIQISPKIAGRQLSREANYFQNKLANRMPYEGIRRRIKVKGYTRIGLRWHEISVVGNDARGTPSGCAS